MLKIFTVLWLSDSNVTLDAMRDDFLITDRVELLLNDNVDELSLWLFGWH